jgi:hypothetical protein
MNYRKSSPSIIKEWFAFKEVGKSNGWSLAVSSFVAGYNAAEHRLHLTAFGVGMLAFLAGFGICWLAFVR